MAILEFCSFHTLFLSMDAEYHIYSLSQLSYLVFIQFFSLFKDFSFFVFPFKVKNLIYLHFSFQPINSAILFFFQSKFSLQKALNNYQLLRD